MPVQRIVSVWKFAIVGMACLLAAQSSYAQETVIASPGNALLMHSAGLQFGQVWAAGNLGEGVSSTTAPGLFYEYRASDIFALKVDLERSSHDDLLTIFSSTAGIRANLVYYDKLVPYAAFGVGLYFVNKRLSPLLEDESSTTHFGVNLTVGSDLDLNNEVFVGMALTLHQLFGDTATAADSTTTEVSGRWSSFLLRAGMRF